MKRAPKTTPKRAPAPARKMRKLIIPGESVADLDDRIVQGTIVSHAPMKWLAVDLEDGAVWRLEPKAAAGGRADTAGDWYRWGTAEWKDGALRLTEGER